MNLNRQRKEPTMHLQPTVRALAEIARRRRHISDWDDRNYESPRLVLRDDDVPPWTP